MNDTNDKEKKIAKKLSKEPIFSVLKAKDFMTKEDISISPDGSIKDALLLMKKHNLTGLPVVEKGGKVVGIISDYDILMQVAQKKLEDKINFKRDLVSVTTETPIKEILITFVRFRVKRIPVVDAFQKLIGMIYRDKFIFKLMEAKISEDKKSEAA